MTGPAQNFASLWDLQEHLAVVCGGQAADYFHGRPETLLAARKAGMLEAEAPFVKMVAGSLTPSERLVLELYYAEKLGVAEISEVLETSEEAVRRTLDGVKRRVTAARKALVAALVEA